MLTATLPSGERSPSWPIVIERPTLVREKVVTIAALTEILAWQLYIERKEILGSRKYREEDNLLELLEEGNIEANVTRP